MDEHTTAQSDDGHDQTHVQEAATQPRTEGGADTVTSAPVAAQPAPAARAVVGVPDADRMDGPAFRELFQMVGAMAFVGLLVAIGWHAAHYSGAWPY
ncbi:hypothetical protein GOB87_06315 [Acetobacter estunensis]|uniref:Uncharacterized protein n=1 Tax=Acetobacter estunensis TaxID=104097 RepID=A0A967B686_9PROT|nr:hypothetical protein [Acetobacter estunensis]NHO53580.1 hypothetical protein [Acetobacter estunensis]